MRFYLLILFVFFYLSCFDLIKAYSYEDNYRFIKNNSSIKIDLYECPSNTTSTIDPTIVEYPLNTCSIDCCMMNHSISSNSCQVTVKSLTDKCLGRFCYFDRCDQFALLVNKNHDQEDKTTMINRIRSSLTNISWSSLVNTTRTKLFVWIDEIGLSTRHLILILLLFINILLTLMTLIVVIRSIRRAHLLADTKSPRYTLL